MFKESGSALNSSARASAIDNRGYSGCYWTTTLDCERAGLLLGAIDIMLDEGMLFDDCRLGG